MNSILLLIPGGSEMIVILLAIFLLFGGKKFPDIIKGLTRGIKEIKNTTEDIKKDINESIDDSTK